LLLRIKLVFRRASSALLKERRNRLKKGQTSSLTTRAKGILLGAASSRLRRPVEHSPEPPSSMLRTDHLGLTVKAKTSEVVTPKMVKELSDDDLD
jgi:hypothetical protein